MKKISKEQIERIAQLAHLKLTEEEIERLQQDMSSILEYFEILDSIDTSQIKETVYVQELKNILRKDEPQEFSDKKMIIKNFPEEDGEFLIVPQEKS